MKKEEDYRAIAAHLNTMRLQNQNQVLTLKEITESIQGILPKTPIAISLLVGTDILIRVKKGYYAFPQDAIHWKRVRHFYEEHRKKMSQYRKVSPTAKTIYGIPVEQVISALKQLDYVIYKKV